MTSTIPQPAFGQTLDPLVFAELGWPQGFFQINGRPQWFYREQREVALSVKLHRQTFVAAGNKLGKDFIAGFVVPWFFLTRHPCRIITTSAKEDHLRVLWGEIGQFIQSCVWPLDWKQGGPLIVNHQELRKVIDGVKCPKSYVRGMVASEDSMAALGGHHIASTDGVPRTLAIIDEASSVSDAYWDKFITWADRILVIGNTWPCENFWKRFVQAGDQSVDGRVFRKVIHVTVEDSPNVRLAKLEQGKGLTPSREIIVPGVKTFDLYREEQEAYADDLEWIAVAHKAEFYEGPENKLFPRIRLDRAEGLAVNLPQVRAKRRARAVGVDPGEGSANTSMVAVDELGIVEIVSRKTPDTSVIDAEIVAFGQRWGTAPENWLVDRGGGGKQIADRLRSKGYNVRTIAFGESVTQDLRRGTSKVPFVERLEVREDRYIYVNRRAEMYGEASMLFDPGVNPAGFGLPAGEKGSPLRELRRQLSLIPKRYDGEGRLWLPPKHAKNQDSSEVTLARIIGGSPDEADAFVLAVHGMLHQPKRIVAGAPVEFRNRNFGSHPLESVLGKPR